MYRYCMIKDLTHNQRKKLRRRHRKEHDRRLADRIKAILLLDEGWTYENVAKALLLDDQTIRNYEKTFSQGGISELLKTSYKGGESKLNTDQEAELKAHVSDKTYHSATAVVAYVEKTYGIKYTTKGMVHLLNRLGFTYKKTKLVPGKADAERQLKFVKEYRELKDSKDDDDEILFMDGVHPQHNPIAGNAWILKGQEKEIPTNTGRKRININGVINSESHEVIVREDERINAQSTIKLFQQIEENYHLAAVIYIIADNARYYRAKMVTEYLENSRIELVFLPPYSPNLNLIERLWKFVKKKTLYDSYYPTFIEFKEAVMGIFKNINLKKYDLELASLLAENFQIIGA